MHSMAERLDDRFAKKSVRAKQADGQRPSRNEAQTASLELRGRDVLPRLSVKAKLAGSYTVILAIVLMMAGLAYYQSELLGGSAGAAASLVLGLRFAVAALAAGAAILSILFIYLANRDITRNIAEIARVAHAVSVGDVSQRATIRTRDEFLDLAQSLERMVSYLEEQAAYAKKVARGDLDATIAPKSELDVLGHSLQRMAENLRRLVDEAAEAEALRRLELSHRRLTGNISHELRTPLGIIKAAITSITAPDFQSDRETMAEYLAMADSECDRLNAMIEGLLEISQIDEASIKSSRRETDIVGLVREVIEEFQPHSDSHTLRLLSKPVSLVAKIHAPTMRQVLRVLLDNAVKYSPEHTRVTVEVDEEPEGIRVSVEDQGLGVAAQDRQAIFEPFYRLPKRDSAGNQVRGLGMGLTTAKQIVAAHGGRIWVEPAQGGGSRFSIKIPFD